ncbi:BTAD domain-containing putative transcriptional regulator [Bordetella trematum]|uniref:BTAD domain-containing putative transcriptional regulator n=1 Tax=Bordetella trematum TaxID=123899 RepID=UPI0015C557D1|nr:BTAD domain-containing putative transcriptional regulator [Bordetella trematum]
MIALGLLGSFRLMVDQCDRTSLLRYDKVKLLAAVLCLSEGRAMHRDVLARMLWPDAPRDQALARLRHALHGLRRALGDVAQQVLSSHDGAIAVPAGVVRVDVLDFLADGPAPGPQRLSLYGGPFLDGLKVPEVDVFMAWRQSWADRLALELLRLRVQEMETLQACGELDQALEAAKAWVQQSPEQEAYHRLLIGVLMQRGERPAALQAYAQCEQALRQHLGVAPASQTRDLVDAAWPMRGVEATPRQSEDYRTVTTLAVALSWQPGEQAASDLDGDLVPDEAVAYLDSWHDQLVEMSRQHGAWLSQASGSTLLAHFGFPQEQSAPVARVLALACAIRALRAPENIRIGQAVHVSLALVDEQQVNAHSLFGQMVVPLAWKARRGEILLSPQAAARLSDWQIEQRRDAASTCFALGEGPWPNDPVYGCQQAFEFLVQQWGRCRERADKQAFWICGGMGLGKSRLAQALLSYGAREGAQPLMLDLAQPDVLAAALAFVQAGPDATRRHALRLCLQGGAGITDGELDGLQARLSQPADEAASPGACRLLHAVAAWAATSRRSLVVVLDHADRLTRDQEALLAEAWKALAAHPAGVLLLILARRDQPALAAAQALPLSPLTPADADRAMNFYARGRRLPGSARDRIRELGRRNPMLIKDMAHMMRLGLPPEYLPRLADRLLEDLAGLDEVARRVLYTAVLWEQASVAGLACACDLDASRTQQVLGDLVARGLLQGASAQGIECAPLWRRALRRLIGKEESRRLYGRLALSLIQARQAHEQIAACLAQAQSSEAALWWRRAIDAALAEGQTGQAAEHLAQALGSLQYMNDVELRRQYEHQSYVTLGALEFSHGGPAAAPASQAYREAARRGGSPQDALPVLWGEWVLAHGAGRLPESLACAKQLQSQAGRLGQSAWYGWGLYAEAQYLFWKGAAQQAEEVLEEALRALSQMASPPSLASALGHHCPAMVHSLLGLTRAVQGRHGPGLQQARLALQLAAQSQSRISAVIAEIQMLRILYLQGDLPALALRSQGLLQALQPQWPGSVWAAVAETYVLYCRLVKGEEIGQDLERLLALAPEFARSMPLAEDAFLCILARCLLAQGALTRAAQALDRVVDIARQRASRLLLPEVHCLRGDLAWVRADQAGAQQAWAVAQQEVLQSGLYAYEDWIRQRRACFPDFAARREWVQRQPG